MHQPLQALIFDVDGTLAETERDAHRVAFNEIFAHYHLGWYWDNELYGKLLAITGGKERIKFYWENYHPTLPPPLSVKREEFIAQLHQMKTARYNELLVTNPIPLRPGVHRLLAEARREGIRLAIATTTNLSNVATLLEHSLSAEAMTWFEVIAAGDMVSAKKPAPDIYQLALNKLGLPAAQCLAIEDSNNGLRAATGAGIATLITVSDYTRYEDFTGARLVVNHLGEPNQPLTVLAGNAGEVRYVDVAFLRQLNNS